MAKYGEKFKRLILDKCGKKNYGNLRCVGRETKQPLRYSDLIPFQQSPAPESTRHPVGIGWSRFTAPARLNLPWLVAAASDTSSCLEAGACAASRSENRSFPAAAASVPLPSANAVPVPESTGNHTRLMTGSNCIACTEGSADLQEKDKGASTFCVD
jgi:hypothetical protein